ncbi:xylitol dehydrogenase [Artomyces pyxidatus]|uniref:Xylitol dehydrogenase n=1 Tax=Artomyces pyxidatus TaxID=48021 RepID=A0ACB8TKA4_9AGAM|nr:xylitol dehydrogenase [Artomyces pyxidatus]
MSDNPSFVLNAIEKVAYEQRPIPEIGDDDVLVEVKKTGICGSDVHYLVHGRIGDFVVESPMVLGHESAGIISKGRAPCFCCYTSYQLLICVVGKNVKSVKAGDRVAMEPGVSCRKCDACKSGRYQLCPDMIFAATPPYDGTLARYYRLPADLVYLLPAHLTLEDGAMMEPLSVAVHSVHSLANLQPNQTIAVFGCGPVGLLCMAVAKALGASRIIAVDIVDSRLEFAKSYAATETYKPPTPQEGESKIAYSKRSSDILKQTLGVEERGDKAIDIVLDASGAEVSIQTGLFIAKIGGTFIQVGMGQPEVVFPVSQLLAKELVVKGSFRYGPGDYRLAIALAAAHRIDLKPMVTHRFKFDDAVTAFKATKAGKSEDGKALIKAIISGPDVSVDEY